MAQVSSDKDEIPSKKKRPRVCLYDSTWEKEYPILPSNNNNSVKTGTTKNYDVTCFRKT